MMVMQPTPSVLHHTAASYTQPVKRVPRKQVRDSRIAMESSIAFSFPPVVVASGEEATIPLRPILNRVMDRPRQAKPNRRIPVFNPDLDDAEEHDDNNTITTFEKSRQTNATTNDDSSHEKVAEDNETKEALPLHTRTDSAPADNYTHRRDRSHFSIPDVIVTSAEEEGERRHYEMRVEPTRRKMSLPLNLAAMTSDVHLMDKTLAPAERFALESEPVTGIPTATNLKTSKSIKGKPKFPVNFATSGKYSYQGNLNNQQSAFEAPNSSNANETNKPEKRPRRSSLSGLFSRKDREAAIATTALPPSPTLQWQQKDPSPPRSQSPSSLNSLSSFFGASPASSRPIVAATSHAQFAHPPSPSLSTTSTQSPHLSPSQSQSPASPTLLQTFGKNKGKKELRAKVKEEQVLIKELEKVDKMVRKHDKEAKKAKKVAAKNSSIEANGNEGKTKRALRRMSVFRPSNINQSVTTKTIPALPLYVKTSVKVVTSQESPNKLIINSIQNRRDSGEDSAGTTGPNTSWNGDVWTDLPLPIDEQLASLTTASPTKRMMALEMETIPLPMKRNASLQRRSSGSQRNITSGKLSTSNRQKSIKRGSDDVNLKTKRRSLLNPSLGLNLDLGSDLEWEDSLESPVNNKFQFSSSPVIPMPLSNKRMSLLESLYKDIQDMEINFQQERKSISTRTQTYKETGNISYNSTLTDESTGKSRQMSNRNENRPPHSPPLVTVQRAGTLPNPVIPHPEKEEEISLTTSTSTPNFF